MHIYAKIYEFAASAGALEGYVYHKEKLDMNALPIWVGNLITAYQDLPAEAREEFQSSLDQTLGRAISSLIPLLGEGSELVHSLKSMVVGPRPESPDDFQKRKWFEK